MGKLEDMFKEYIMNAKRSKRGPKNARRKKNSNYRAGSESVPALEESLYTEDDLG
jgi:hypothetical protein